MKERRNKDGEYDEDERCVDGREKERENGADRLCGRFVRVCVGVWVLV